ncbi:hypothetical protein PFISCL1PPCAC_16140, partial [Pristionchus fissidentatus]
PTPTVSAPGRNFLRQYFVVKCIRCKGTFHALESYEEHAKTACLHQESPSRAFPRTVECMKCNRSYRTPVSLLQHIATTHATVVPHLEFTTDEKRVGVAIKREEILYNEMKGEMVDWS